jgi:hypothetical protein
MAMPWAGASGVSRAANDALARDHDPVVDGVEQLGLLLPDVGCFPRLRQCPEPLDRSRRRDARPPIDQPSPPNGHSPDACRWNPRRTLPRGAFRRGRCRSRTPLTDGTS